MSLSKSVTLILSLFVILFSMFTYLKKISNFLSSYNLVFLTIAYRHFDMTNSTVVFFFILTFFIVLTTMTLYECNYSAIIWYESDFLCRFVCHPCMHAIQAFLYTNLWEWWKYWKSFWLLYQYDLLYYIIKSSFKQLRWSLYYYDSLFTILEQDCEDCLECCSWCQNTSSKLNLTCRDLEHVIDQHPWLIMLVPYRCLA